MSRAGTVSAGIQGALLLARGRPEGIQLVDTDRTAAIRSFWAIPLCLPTVICMRLPEWIHSGPLALGRYLLVFLVSWLLFVWVSHHMAAVLDRQGLWPRFIAVWAYCSVVENMLVALGGVPGVLGVPSIVDQLCEVVTCGWALWLEWYAIRLSLQVGPWTALVVLIVDIAIGFATAVVSMLLG
jgi:hypothetical protein